MNLGTCCSHNRHRLLNQHSLFSKKDALKHANSNQEKKSYIRIAVVGGFDAYQLNCTDDMFIDWHHAKPICLEKIISQIPNL